MEDRRRRLVYINGGLQERLGFNGGRLTFKHRRLVLKLRRPTAGAEVHGSRRAVQSQTTTIQEPGAAMIQELGAATIHFLFF
jgi:hypothetical protein